MIASFFGTVLAAIGWLILFIGVPVGLVHPPLVLRWIRDPSRIQVLKYGLPIGIFVAGIGHYIQPADPALIQERLAQGEQFMALAEREWEAGNYEAAKVAAEKASSAFFSADDDGRAHGRRAAAFIDSAEVAIERVTQKRLQAERAEKRRIEEEERAERKRIEAGERAERKEREAESRRLAKEREAARAEDSLSKSRGRKFQHPLLDRYPYIVSLWEDGIRSFADLDPQEAREVVEGTHRKMIDSTYSEDLQRAIRAGDRLLKQSLAAIGTRDFDRARSLLDSVGYRLHSEYRVSAGTIPLTDQTRKALLEAQRNGWLSPALQGRNLDSLFAKKVSGFYHLHPGEGELWSQEAQSYGLWSLLAFRREEAEQEEAEALSTRENTFERFLEVKALRSFYVHPRLKGMTPRPFLAAGNARFLKSIEVTGDELTLNMRRNDCHEVDILQETLSLTHPRKTLEGLKGFMEFVYRDDRFGKLPPPWCELCYEFDRIDEVTIALYFPGGEEGTETVIARFGLGREFYDRDKWKKLKASDGTFQDFLKSHGTYWLHPDMPDMGTPAHLLR